MNRNGVDCQGADAPRNDIKGHLALRAYQVSGGSESGEYVGWKLFHVQNMQSVAVQPTTFAGARTGYKQGDKAFTSIRAQF